MRNTLLIGSMPFQDETDAMTRALEALGSSLLTLPDGEVGERSAAFPNGNRSSWIVWVVDKISQDTTSWEVVKGTQRNPNGLPIDYNSLQRVRPKRSPSEMHHYLEFGYDTYFKQNYAIFKELRAKYGLPNLKFQFGVPTGLGLAFTIMSPPNAIRYAPAFNRRIAYEVNEIVKIGGDDVVIQIELPGETALAYQLPPFLVELATLSVRNLIQQITSNTQIGIHLCLSDLNHEALVHPKTLHKLVALSNKLVQRWSPRHRLAYMHFPLAEAAIQPRMDAAYYEPLKQVRLPAHTRFAAGFVHEKLSDAEHQQLLQIIERMHGKPVDIACSCGLGRRSSDMAQGLIEQMGRLSVVKSSESYLQS